MLTITGVRQGESAIRDKRIEMSCSKDGAECGQGWYQQVLPDMKGVRGRLATLAPILHWRVCNVWDWLRVYAPMRAYGGWATAMLADAYGGDEAEEANARTGCVGCPLAARDKALEAVVALPAWSYLAPLLGLRPIYRELRLAGTGCASRAARPARTGRWYRTSSAWARSPCRRAWTRSTNPRHPGGLQRRG